VLLSAFCLTLLLSGTRSSRRNIEMTCMLALARFN